MTDLNRIVVNWLLFTFHIHSKLTRKLIYLFFVTVNDSSPLDDSFEINQTKKRAIIDDDSEYESDIGFKRKKCKQIQYTSDSESEGEKERDVDANILNTFSPNVSIDSPEIAIDIDELSIDWKDLKFEEIVGKRRDCNKLLYTIDEKQIYGRNRTVQSTGETAYLCKLYGDKTLKCKSRLYLKNGRLYRKMHHFIEHNHPTQEKKRKEYEIENDIKTECANLNALVNSNSQTSAVASIFEKHVKQ